MPQAYDLLSLRFNKSLWMCRWKSLEASKGSLLCAEDISWPPDQGRILQATARLAMQRGQACGMSERNHHVHQCTDAQRVSEAAYRSAFRHLSLRWHPDKFQSKYGFHVPEREQAAVLERVCAIFQCVSSQWQQHVEDQDR